MASFSGAASGAAAGASMGSIVPGWGTAIGGIVGGVAGAFGAFGDDSGDDAAKAMEEAQLRMEARLDKSVADIAGQVDNYYDTLDQIQANFDPYDMSKSFASFYEGVLQPMEIEFEEFILPSITSAYSGGVFGSEASLSGASKESELKAKQKLSTDKGTLRAGERENTINRNISLADREQATAADRLQAGTLAPTLSSGQAGSIFQAEQSAIETQYAADRSTFESILNIPSAIVSGVQSGSSIQAGLDRMRGTQDKTAPNRSEAAKRLGL